jgi:hypothetical protein
MLDQLNVTEELGAMADALAKAGVVDGAGKPVSKYAAKKAKKAKKVTESVEVVQKTASEPEASNLETNDLFGDIEAILLGDEQDDLYKMEALRDEAEKLMQQSKSMSARIRDEVTSVYRQAYKLRMKTLFDAERMFFNDTKARFFNTVSWEVIQARFLKMQDAWHQKDGDPELKANFQAVLDKCIENYPQGKMIDAHKANQNAAFQLEFNLECSKAEQEKVYLEAQGKFDEANEIAKAHGWPITAKKEVKYGK